MRTLIKFSFVFMMLALVASCKNDKATKAGAAETKAAPTAAAVQYTLSSGTVNWTGSKVAYDHKGTINISKGMLSAEGNKIVSGNFIMDMASLMNTDIPEAEKKAKLEDHLKGADFFDVAKYPTASFSVTSAETADMDDANTKITGNLTMKGETKSITFPALVVAKADGSLTAISSKFTIDRNDWGVKYGSGLAGAVGDKIISDNVDLQIELMAKKMTVQ